MLVTRSRHLLCLSCTCTDLLHPMYDAPHLIYIHDTNNISEVFTSTSRYFGFFLHIPMYIQSNIYPIVVFLMGLCDKQLTRLPLLLLPLLLLPLPSCHSGRCCTAVLNQCCLLPLLAMLPATASVYE